MKTSTRALFGCFTLASLTAQAQTVGELTLTEISTGSKTRSFYYYLPSDWRGEELPLLFNWHGFGNDAFSYNTRSKSSDYAERFGWALIVPRGWGAIQPGHNGGGCCCCAQNDDVQFAKDMLSFVQSLGVTIREDGIFSMGYSNGGFMSHRLACEADNVGMEHMRIRGIGATAGYKSFGGSFQECNPNHNTNVVHIHGTADRTVSYNNWRGTSFEQNMEDYVDINQCSTADAYDLEVTATTTCRVFPSCAQGTQVQFCTVENGPHTWFDGTNGDIDATDYYFEAFNGILNSTGTV